MQDGLSKTQAAGAEKSAPAAWAAQPEADLQASIDRYRVELIRTGDNKSWEMLASELVPYALDVVKAWIETGRIFTLVAHQGWQIRASEEELKVLQSDPFTSEDLAMEMVATATVRLKQQIVNGYWNPALASLRTYFVGGVVLQFPNAFRHWRAAYRRNQCSSIELEQVDSLAGNSPDPADSAVANDEARWRLATTPTALRTPLALMSLGYTLKEAAESVNMSERALEGRLRRWRVRTLERTKPTACRARSATPYINHHGPGTAPRR